MQQVLSKEIPSSLHNILLLYTFVCGCVQWEIAAGECKIRITTARRNRKQTCL